MSNPDWWGACRDDWVRVLTPYRDQVKRVLEVGSWEGFSAVFWHRFFGASVDCIDNWCNPTLSREVADAVQDNFRKNTEGLPIFGFKRHSTEALFDPIGTDYDLIYIDGDHYRNQVMVDSVLAWPLLRPGGIMIWDDYRDYCPDLPDNERPETAICLFLEMVSGEYAPLADTGRQLYVRKV